MHFTYLVEMPQKKKQKKKTNLLTSYHTWTRVVKNGFPMVLEVVLGCNTWSW